MQSKTFWSAVYLNLILGLAIATGALAQAAPPAHMGGLINDYTPETGVSGPWEMRGDWSLALNEHSGKANFSAVLNMTHSDYWIVLNPSAVDDDTSTGRHPHTHHINLNNVRVTQLTTGGFEMSGPVTVSADGSPAPFMSSCSPSAPCTLTVDVTGGSSVELSNITLTFGGPPTTHFGTQPIHGVVRRRKESSLTGTDR